MTACQSVAGEWGGICPDCGGRLPARPGPLRSWKATRPQPDGIRWDGQPLAPGRVAQSTAQRARVIREQSAAPLPKYDRPPRLELAVVLALVRRHAGNLSNAAFELGASRTGIEAFLERHRDEVPMEVRDLVDARRRHGLHRRIA